ncbi:bacterial surface protein [Paenibacillus sp. FSL L8-0158]|uniref:bacterial surface protein n=1 Tax=Paenibacillus sp. FSL L8-0158 TaxID=2954752 RepID=UPI0031589A42
MKKLSTLFLLSLILLFGFNQGVYAATVGDSLTFPEEGWNRYDDTDSHIQYEGDGWFKSTNGTFYNGSETLTNDNNEKFIKFNFTGTKIRLITTVSIWKTQNYTLTLDGVEYPYTQYNKKSAFQAISFEKTGLPQGEHTLIIKTNGAIGMDAFDIDGILKTYNPDIKTTPGQDTPKDIGRAILVVTMNTGLEKEFDLSMKEVNDFIAWYEAKQAGTGTASYAINKHKNNIGPFSSRNDYVIFNKILTFEVSEYSTK